MRNEGFYYADGRWNRSASERFIEVVNPANGQAVGRVPHGGAADVEAAVRSARDALPSWSGLSRAVRIALLNKVRDYLADHGEQAARLITTEIGAPISFSRTHQAVGPVAAIDTALALAETLPAEERIGDVRVLRCGAGVVAVVTSCDFPLFYATARMVAALVMGCTVVLKPSELAPLDAELLADAVEAAGLPTGVFNLVHGTGETAGRALVTHPLVDLVSFTGTTAHGRDVARSVATHLKPTVLSLSGRSANLLLPGADLDAALPRILEHAWLNAGQFAASMSRLLVPTHLASEIEERLAALAAGWTLGDPLDENTRMGPVVSMASRDRISGLIAHSVTTGARIVSGGAQVPPGFAGGAFVQPTILSSVVPGTRADQEEIYGPVLTVTAYDGEDQGTRLANANLYGLAAGVWSSDTTAGLRVAKRLTGGQVSINSTPTNLLAPFGGQRFSGYGREFGIDGLYAYSVTKTLSGI